MARTRRDFLKLGSAAAGSMLLASSEYTRFWAEPAGKSLKILVFGGTGFLGPGVIDAAVARGHVVSMFNRGKTNPTLYPNLEKLKGDRDPDKDEGIKALVDRKWDVVIDDTGYYPRMVKASATTLAPNVRQYIYVSSISAYASNATENADETAPLAKLEDPKVETMGDGYQFYGGLKALCEQAVSEALPGRATIVRPGFIVGPNDRTDRFTWWPVRVARGGEMIAPGAPTDPVQIIDVRDLGAWLVLLAEKNTIGTFNAVGPKGKLTMQQMIDACRAATKVDPKLTWISSDFMLEQGENGDGQIPIWLPYTGEYKGFHTWSNARAIKAGLTFRPILDTTRDTLAWFRSLPDERQAKMGAGLSPEAEKRILAAWHAKQTKG